MNCRCARFLLAIIWALSVGGAAADIVDGAKERRLSLATPSKGIVLPKDDWTIGQEQRRADGGAVYYMLSSESRQISFSVFLERTAACDSSASCLALALKNPQYKTALDMRQSDEGEFRVAQFYLDKPGGAPIQQAHILASAYVEGIWFDVHISKVSGDRPDMVPLIRVLRDAGLR
jgi:hypothetical protein